MNLSLATISIALIGLGVADAFKMLAFSPQLGLIGFSHRHRFHWNQLPRFRKLHLSLPPTRDAFGNGVHDAENAFHLLKELPHDCFTYVRHANI
jgi:hypothetical protein